MGLTEHSFLERMEMMGFRQTSPDRCPFCGGPGVVKAGQKQDRFSIPVRGWVGCPTCGIYKQWVNSPDGAIKVWNRRVDDA